MNIQLGKKYRERFNNLEFEVLEQRVAQDKKFGDVMLWKVGYTKDHKYYTEWHTNTFLENLQIEEL